MIDGQVYQNTNDRDVMAGQERKKIFDWERKTRAHMICELDQQLRLHKVIKIDIFFFFLFYFIGRHIRTMSLLCPDYVQNK